ncbi:MAG: FecR family protein [candidate division KSB1 bacterium]|nr:FecR family protein [candidate division KSB1 bacterium]MDZ7302348.1 FecR family protein [candidate division KSB1 bacterium]MDZ7311200.1 FecR family protein [candidate division KSB1 bacterium]
MRKILLFMLLLAIPGLGTAGLSVECDHLDDATAPLWPVEQEKDVALVLKTVGQVQITYSYNNAWLKATQGTRLHDGTQVRTGDQSLAAIVFTDDKSMLKVRSNSKVVINGKRETAASGSRRIAKTIAMEIGELWAKVTKGSAPFRIETPSGVAAVKGTIFYALIDASGRFHIICLDGLVELINQYGSAMVHAGETGTSSSGQAPQSRPTNSGELPNWANDNEGGGNIEIEFQDQNGQKKKLKIRYE